MEIISIRKVQGIGSLKAFLDIRINGVVIKGCTVYEGKRGRLSAHLPRKLSTQGTWINVITLLEDEAQKEFEDKALEAYDKELGGGNAHK